MFMRSGLVLRSAVVCAVAVIALAAASVESSVTTSSNSAKSVESSLAEPQVVSTVAESTEPESSAALQALTAEDARVVLFTIRPTGFEPREITLPAGQYLVVVRNRSGLREFTFSIERSSGERIYETRTSRFKSDTKYLDLPPGTYTFREVNHRDWICRVTVTSR